MLGAAWRVNLALPDGGLSLAREQRDAIIDLCAAPGPTSWPFLTARIAIPITSPRTRCSCVPCSIAVFDGFFRVSSRGGPAASSSTSSTIPVVPTVLVDVSDVYERSSAALACHRSQFAPDERARLRRG